MYRLVLVALLAFGLGTQAPAGARVDAGQLPGPRAAASSLDDLIGQPCNQGSAGAGTLSVTYAPGGAVSLACIATARPRLSVNVTGSGTVASAPAGIDCGSTCAAEFALGTSVTLAATAAPGYVFSHWGGGCSGTGACAVAAGSVQTVSAVFTRTVRLTVVHRADPAHPGAYGQTTSHPAGISCGAQLSRSAGTCTASLPAGTVTLHAVGGYALPDGYSVDAMDGVCSKAATGAGWADCTFDLETDTTISVTFGF